MRLVRMAAAGAAGFALVGVVYGMGAASAAPSAGPAARAASTAAVPRPGATGGSDEGRWVQRFCTNRLPRIQDRQAKAVARLSGDAGTKGSIAALQQRIAAAKAAGRDAEADLLSILLDHRQQRLPMLRSTQQALAGWQHSYCPAG